MYDRMAARECRRELIRVLSYQGGYARGVEHVVGLEVVVHDEATPQAPEVHKVAG